MIKTLYGTWKHPSVFITTDGKVLQVFAYKSLIRQVTFPSQGYIQLHGKIVKNFLNV